MDAIIRQGEIKDIEGILQLVIKLAGYESLTLLYMDTHRASDSWSIEV